MRRLRTAAVGDRGYIGPPSDPFGNYPGNIYTAILPGYNCADILTRRVLMSNLCTAFAGQKLLARGPLAEVALAAKAALMSGSAETILVFDDGSGRVIDLDLRGDESEVVERLPEPAPEARGRGRPKLGVISREVTLLPRHWDWLAAEPGGVSAALRRLVDEARHNSAGRQERRATSEACYRFMTTIAGNLPGYEEAIRALFAADRARMEESTIDWPEDVRAHALRLIFETGDPS